MEKLGEPGRERPRMSTLVRPVTNQDVETAVLKALEAHQDGLKFPQLERAVLNAHPNIKSPFAVRKAAWRLISKRKARLAPGLFVRSRGQGR
jgi:hypothetical protein